MRVKACLPADQATAPFGPTRDVIDPAMLWVDGENRALALRVGGHDLAVVAAGDDALAVRRRRQDRAGVVAARRCAPSLRDQQQRLLAEHERRSIAEEPHGDDRHPGRDRPRAPATEGMSVRVSVSSLPHPGSRKRERVMGARPRTRAVRRAADHARQLSKPCRIFSSGRLRPMKTARLSRFSPSFQGR